MLKFVTREGKAPVYHASVGGEQAQLSMDGDFEWIQVEVGNARTADTRWLLDEHGFQQVSQSSEVNDFYDDRQIDDAWRPVVERLVAEHTGASRVVVFDHTRRSDAAAVRGRRQTREPSAVVHNDYTEKSGPQRMRDLLPADEVEQLLSCRFAIVNVWRGIERPVLRSPLALCEAAAIAPDDLVKSERRARDRIGEIYLTRYNPAQRWWYFPALALDEAILIKTFDSARDGRARFSVHTAFDDPETPADAPPRESIESRAFAFFD